MGWTSILVALWLFLPAFVANMSPVFTAKAFPWWGRPIDGGRRLPDGQRLLGDGKTWRGLVGGGVTGGLTAVALAYGAAGPFAAADFGLGAGAHPVRILFFGFLVGLMALAGDAVESFLKRRIGKKRGAPWFPFDQLDFVVFGLLGVLLGAPLLPPGWAREAYLDPWVLGTLLIGTPVLHLAVNRIGYWLRLKEVPW